MKLLSYKINKITDGDDYNVTFIFDDESTNTQIIEFKDIHDTYKTKLNNDENISLDNPVYEIDSEGNKIIETKAEDNLHKAIIDHANAYIQGKELEKDQSSTHPDIKRLIDQERKVE